MNKPFLKDAVGVMLFAFVAAYLIGWIIMPFGAAIAFWVAFKKMKGHTLHYFCLVALVWMSIATC